MVAAFARGGNTPNKATTSVSRNKNKPSTVKELGYLRHIRQEKPAFKRKLAPGQVVGEIGLEAPSARGGSRWDTAATSTMAELWE